MERVADAVFRAGPGPDRPEGEVCRSVRFGRRGMGRSRGMSRRIRRWGRRDSMSGCRDSAGDDFADGVGGRGDSGPRGDGHHRFEGGFSHLMLALLSPRTSCIRGDPGVSGSPAAGCAASGSVMSVAGGDDAFLARIEDTLQNLQPRPKLVIFNYPHNPSAASRLSRNSGRRRLALAKKYNVLLISDFAYGETCFGDYIATELSCHAGGEGCGRRIFRRCRSRTTWRGGASGSAAGTMRWCGRSRRSRGITTTGILRRFRLRRSWRTLQRQVRARAVRDL